MWWCLLELDTEYRYWSFMEAHPAHNSLPVKAKVEAMDVLTWAWTGNGFKLLIHVSFLILFSSYRASLAIPSCCSCPFQSRRMPRVDDAYSILRWYALAGLFFSADIFMYETDDHHDDHGIQTRIVSRVLLRVGESTFA